MNTAHEAAIADDDTELLIERVFNAPRALVYAAWTQKAHLAQWSCPLDMTLSAVEFDGDAVTPGSTARSYQTSS